MSLEGFRLLSSTQTFKRTTKDKREKVDCSPQPAVEEGRMPWNERKPMGEGLRFTARLLAGEKTVPIGAFPTLRIDP